MSFNFINQNSASNYSNEDSVRDGYPQFENQVKDFFATVTAKNKKLFLVNAEDLFDLYIENLPAEARAHYTCNGCKHFINRFGKVVAINEKGKIESAMWNEKKVPEFFKPAVKAMKQLVLKSKVVSVFVPESQKLGYSKTGEWTHIHALVPRDMVHSSRLKEAHQVAAELNEEFKMVHRALQDFTVDTTAKALELIEADVLYRGNKVKANIEWFHELIQELNTAKTAEQKRNLVWLAVATAPAGFTHIRSSAAGTLLKDISEGYTVTEIAEKFRQVMDPSNYQRSQTGPSAAAVYEAEKTIEKLGDGVKLALERRYAQFNEVPLIWQGTSPIAKALANSKSGVFTHLLATEAPGTSLNVPAKPMTWEKFYKTVMPSATSIELLVDNPNQFMALVTAANEDAENIFNWDNPFTWYYHGGADAEMRKRLEEFGARYENNEIRVSLMWEGLTDLDLHCVTPKGAHIYYHNKRDSYGGFLDLDMNGIDKTSTKPVENVRWEKNAPEGRYRFYVNNYNEKVDRYRGTPFKAELEINGKVYHIDGDHLRNNENQTIFEFEYKKGQDPIFRNNKAKSAGNAAAWGVEQNKFVKVKGITTSPNLWGENPNESAGAHIFFLLEGAKDETEGLGRGFFNEMLKGELKPIRRTLELFTAKAPIQGAEEADACGIGYSKDSDWGVTLRVKTDNSSRLVKIDRWD